LKVEEEIFDLRLRGLDIAIVCFPLQLVGEIMLENHKMAISQPMSIKSKN
jgi:hypothetical protein